MCIYFRGQRGGWARRAFLKAARPVERGACTNGSAMSLFVAVPNSKIRSATAEPARNDLVDEYTA
jgi:hypothetical protein